MKDVRVPTSSNPAVKEAHETKAKVEAHNKGRQDNQKNLGVMLANIEPSWRNQLGNFDQGYSVLGTLVNIILFARYTCVGVKWFSCYRCTISTVKCVHDTSCSKTVHYKNRLSIDIAL